MSLSDMMEYRVRFGSAATFLKGWQKAYEIFADWIFRTPLVDDICFHASCGVLRGYQNEEATLSDVLYTATHYSGFGAYKTINPQQIQSELRRLAERGKEIGPSVVMEIGTAEGGTLYTWSRHLNPDIVISVDLPGGIHGGGYPEEKRKFYSQFSDAEYHLLRTDSQSDETRKKIQEILGERSIDFLYIDGDHTYSGVKADFEQYSPLVRDGGLIAFHDIVEHPHQPEIDIDKFWRELEESYKTERLVADPGYQEWAGIGVIHWLGEG